MTTYREALAQTLKLNNTNQNQIQMRLVRLGLGETCTRCGGSGKYSFNQVHGSMCYGCNGTGQMMPKASVALERAKEAATDGRLDTYIEQVKLRNKAKKATDRALKIWRSTGVEKFYKWQTSAQAKNKIKNGEKLTWEERQHLVGSNANKLCANAFEKVSNKKCEFLNAVNKNDMATAGRIAQEIENALKEMQQSAERVKEIMADHPW